MKVTVREELVEARENFNAKLEELYHRNFSICYEDNDPSILLAQSELRFEKRYAEFLGEKAVRLDKDWEYIKWIELRTVEPLTCVICLSSSAEMVMPTLLRCQHVFCMPCVVRQCLESPADCSVCKKKMCWKEMRPAAIESVELAANAPAEFVLMKKNVNTREVFQEGSEARILEVRAIEQSAFERRLFAQLDGLLRAAEQLEVDAYVARVCEFIHLKAIGSFRNTPQEFHKHTKRCCALEKHAKKFCFYYQLGSRHNVFVHPVEFESLRGAMELPRALALRVREVKRVSQTATTRKIYREFAHLPLGSDYLVVSVHLAEYLSPADLNALSRRKKAAEGAFRKRQTPLRREARPCVESCALELEDFFITLTSTSTGDDFPQLIDPAPGAAPPAEPAPQPDNPAPPDEWTEREATFLSAHERKRAPAAEPAVEFPVVALKRKKRPR